MMLTVSTRPACPRWPTGRRATASAAPAASREGWPGFRFPAFACRVRRHAGLAARCRGGAVRARSRGGGGRNCRRVLGRRAAGLADETDRVIDLVAVADGEEGGDVALGVLGSDGEPRSGSSTTGDDWRLPSISRRSIPRPARSGSGTGGSCNDGPGYWLHRALYKVAASDLACVRIGGRRTKARTRGRTSAPWPLGFGRARFTVWVTC